MAAYTLRHTEKVEGPSALAYLSCEFGDLPDLISTEGVPSDNMGYFENIGHFSSGEGPAWYGGLKSMTEARALILAGWQAGAARASETTSRDGMISSLAQPESIRRRPLWADDGDDLCCDRALEGNWERAFRRMSRVRTYGSKIVSLGGMFGGNCTKSAEQLFWSGAQIVVASELLEAAGYQVEIRGLHINNFWSAQGAKGVVEFRAKEAGDPLRLDAIASIFAHAGVFRTYGFMGICRMPWDVGHGLGRTIDDMGEAHEVLDRAVSEGFCLPFDTIMPLAYTKEAAIKNIVAAVTKVTAQPEAA